MILGSLVWAWPGMRSVALAIVLSGCAFPIPGTGSPSLPNDFPADFPTPPNATLLSASGPAPYMPPEARGFYAQWSSSLSRAELEAFYGAPHSGWHTDRTLPPPSALPFGFVAPTVFLFTHESDGMQASTAIGLSNPIDHGTLVQVTILPPRPTPTPTPR